MRFVAAWCIGLFAMSCGSSSTNPGEGDGGSAGTAGSGGAAASGGVAANVIHCGSFLQACNVPTQVCCSNGSTGYTCPSVASCDCTAADSCTGLRLECDEDSDCSGNVCCALRDPAHPPASGYLEQASCMAEASCTSPEYVRLCDPADAEACPANAQCKTFPMYAGLGQCH